MERRGEELEERLLDFATRVGKAVDALLDTIAGSLQNGEDVRLTGFGSFSVAHRSARMGRNPRTGAQLHIAASNQPKFKAGKTLKSAVNN